MLPKINQTTILKKGRAPTIPLPHSPKIVIEENDQLEKRRKMAIIINDYLENFKTR
jgi:hypothetical protein